MPSTEPLSRSGISSRAGLSADVMTFWDRRGLLRPLPRRTPTSRRQWPWYDANIAALMMQLRQFGMPMEGMLSIAAQFREAIAWAESYGLDHDSMFGLWSVFTAHEFHARGEWDDDQLEEDLNRWSNERHGSRRITPEIRAIHAQMPKAEFRQKFEAFLLITEQPKPGDRRAQYFPDMTYFWRVGEEWRFERGEGGPRQARDDGALSTIAVDVSTVIFDVWAGDLPEEPEEKTANLEPAR